MAEKELNVNRIDPRSVAEFCVSCAENKLAENVISIPVGHSSSIADFFVIATANSEPQLNALSDYLSRQVREKFQIHAKVNGGPFSGGWVLLDFGDVLVHLMTPETRSRYNLEGLWGETPEAEALQKLQNISHE